MCVGGGGGGYAIPNSFGHLLGSPKTLIKLNDLDSIIKCTVRQIAYITK